MKNKFSKLQQILEQSKLDALIVTNSYNILYLAGFKGISPQEREAILVVSKKPTLITAAIYKKEAQKVASKSLTVKIALERAQANEFTAAALKNLKRVGFEDNNLTVGELKDYKKLAPNSRFIATKNLIEDLRVTKTEEEINKIEKAQKISQKAFEQIIKTVKPGQTEEEIAHNLLSIIQNLGGQGLAFETIVASGPNSGSPHHLTGKRKIKKGEILLFDFGTKYQDYCADLSRTIFTGRARNEHKNVYHHVKTAQKTAIEKIKHNLKAQRAFSSANDVFKENKLHKNFLHGLGHGIGLEVHEAPNIGSKSKSTLTQNMVFSVEPGLYFPWGGVRIEDLVTIKGNSAKVLGKTQEEIIEI